MSLVNHLIFVTFFFLITSPFEDFVDHSQSAEPSPNNCTDLWDLTSSGDKSCTDCIVFFHIIIGLLEQLTKEKRAKASIFYQWLISNQWSSNWWTLTQRVQEDFPGETSIGMRQILNNCITHCSIHLLDNGPALNTANLLLYPAPAPLLLWPLKRQIKILVSEKPPLLITSSHLKP